MNQTLVELKGETNKDLTISVSTINKITNQKLRQNIEFDNPNNQ